MQGVINMDCQSYKWVASPSIHSFLRVCFILHTFHKLFFFTHSYIHHHSPYHHLGHPLLLCPLEALGYCTPFHDSSLLSSSTSTHVSLTHFHPAHSIPPTSTPPTLSLPHPLRPTIPQPNLCYMDGSAKAASVSEVW